MELGFLGQQLWNGVMLGTIYAMVAVGFTLFFGVLDVIKFSHGDVLTLGVFAALATLGGLSALGVESTAVRLVAATLAGVGGMALLGAGIARAFILPLREAPSFIVLLVTLMVGTVIREGIRLFYPGGSNPQSFPHLLPSGGIELGGVTLRFDSLILLAAGLGTICAVHLLITRTRLGLAIRAVAQDGETARVMGIDFTRVVLFTFALGSGLAALAGLINGLYYSEVNFGTGLMLGVIGFSAAVVGGLGNLYGAILGGFLFAALQMLAVVALPLASEYKDVVAFAAVIALIGLKPTGLIGERAYERV